MKYPLPDEYHQAIQNPHICFVDTDLKHSSIKTNANGLPTVCSGNFASVYKVQNGKKAFAIRCFLSHFPDAKDRYQKISGCLNTINCKYFVKFNYLENGINVKGNFYPILKMEWTEGKTFGSLVDECINRKDRQSIVNIRNMFVDLIRELRNHNISHCDLQHGNILMTGQGLKLVDYDGMYVPKLNIPYSNELGHPNYQHPKRSGRDFNQQTDNFSAIVIYTALSVLLHNFGFWSKYSNGENFLFTQKDFSNCNNSLIFKELDNFNDSEVKKLSSELRLACNKPVAQCPDFLSLIGYVQPLPQPALNVTSWIETWSPADSQQNNQTDIQSTGIEWIQSWLQTDTNVIGQPVPNKSTEYICRTVTCKKFGKKVHKIGAIYCDTCGTGLIKDQSVSQQFHGFGLKCCIKCNARINTGFIYCPNCGEKT